MDTGSVCVTFWVAAGLSWQCWRRGPWWVRPGRGRTGRWSAPCRWSSSSSRRRRSHESAGCPPEHTQICILVDTSRRFAVFAHSDIIFCPFTLSHWYFFTSLIHSFLYFFTFYLYLLLLSSFPSLIPSSCRDLLSLVHSSFLLFLTLESATWPNPSSWISLFTFCSFSCWEMAAGRRSAAEKVKFSLTVRVPITTSSWRHETITYN